MGTFTETARIIYKADTKEAERALDRLRRKTERMQENMRSQMRKGIALTIASTAAIGSSIQAYMRQEQAERQVAQAIAHTGKAASVSMDYIRQITSEFQDLSTHDDDLAMGLLNLGIRMADLQKHQMQPFLVTSADLSTVLGLELSSASRTLAKALSDPARNLQTLSRYGVRFTIAQTEMVKEMSKAGDIIGAQDMVLSLLEERYGGAAHEASKVTGVIPRMKNAMIDFQEQVGKSLFHTLKPAIHAVSDAFRSWQLGQVPHWTAQFLRFGAALGGAMAGLAAVRLGIIGVKFALLGLGVAAGKARIAVGLFWGTLTLGLGTIIAFAPEIAKNFSMVKVFFDSVTNYILTKIGGWTLHVRKWGNQVLLTWEHMKRDFWKKFGAWGKDDEMLFQMNTAKIMGSIKKLEGGITAAAEHAETSWKNAVGSIGAMDFSLDAGEVSVPAESGAKTIPIDEEAESEKEAKRKRLAYQRMMDKRAEAEAELELQRAHHERLSDEEIEFLRKRHELEAAMRATKYIEDEATREATVEAILLQYEILEAAEQEHLDNLRQKQLQAHDARQAAVRKQYKWEQAEREKAAKKEAEAAATKARLDQRLVKEGFAVLEGLAGKHQAAMKVLKIADLWVDTYMSVPIILAQSIRDLGAVAGPPYAAKLTALMYAKAAVGTAGILAAQRGGEVPGPYTGFDSRLILAQPGEHIVPVGKPWDEVKRGILREGEMDGSADRSPPTHLQLELVGEAGDLFRLVESRDRAVRGA